MDSNSVLVCLCFVLLFDKVSSRSEFKPAHLCYFSHCLFFETKYQTSEVKGGKVYCNSQSVEISLCSWLVLMQGGVTEGHPSGERVSGEQMIQEAASCLLSSPLIFCPSCYPLSVVTHTWSGTLWTSTSFLDQHHIPQSYHLQSSPPKPRESWGNTAQLFSALCRCIFTLM